MNVGIVPVIRAFNRCIVVVGGSARNLKTHDVNDPPLWWPAEEFPFPVISERNCIRWTKSNLRASTNTKMSLGKGGVGLHQFAIPSRPWSPTVFGRWGSDSVGRMWSERWEEWRQGPAVSWMVWRLRRNPREKTRAPTIMPKQRKATTLTFSTFDILLVQRDSRNVHKEGAHPL